MVAKPAARSFFNAVADFESGKDTPRAFLDRCLASLAEFEPVVGAFVHLEIDPAKAAADQSTERWRQGKPLSRIDGMPLGIKDIIETIDMPTQCGSPLYEGWRSGRDAASVAALRQAGAVILGKTVTTEFAATVPRGTRNPWDLERTPGGSSSGSAAAVATGMVPAALGTQVIGSILRPASFCGVVGFKPTIGAINRGGSHDGLSQSAHGPLAASLEDAWTVAWEIANRVGGDPGYPGLYGPEDPPAAKKPKRLALIETTGWAAADPSAKAAFEAAVAKIRAAGVEVAGRQIHRGLAAVEAALERATDISRRINGWESIWPLNAYRAKDASKVSDVMLARLAESEAMTLENYRSLLSERERIRAEYAKLAADFDAAVMLSAPGPAPLGLGSTGNPVFNVPASLLGVPAVTLPVLSADGLPLGFQTMGYLHRDAALFSAAAWLRDLLSAKR
ncbi:MAG: amidase [Betaproteobacteria bacterium]|nr:amidase [Betaproteobacteria bacterium]